MKTISDIKGKKQIIFNGFGGIDVRKSCNNYKGAADIVNFRIREDGSLQKREGSRRLANIDGELRGVWTGKAQGNDSCYLLSGNTLFHISESGEKTAVAALGTATCRSAMFYYRGVLYLTDGEGLYKLTESGLERPMGYAPLVGKGWLDGEVGAINQPRNIISRQARYNYTVGETVVPVFNVDSPLDRVDSVSVNGAALPTDRYRLLSSKTAVNITGLSAHDDVTIYVSYAEDDTAYEQICKCTYAKIFGGANSSRPMLWGNAESPDKIYAGGYIGEDEVNEARGVYPECDALYFPRGGDFSVADGQYAVRAVSRHYDRMLIFTEGGTYMASSPDTASWEIPVMNINSRVGVLSAGAVAELENQPCSVGEFGIYRWSSETDELNDCNAYLISDPISELLDGEFYRNASVYADVGKRELLFTVGGRDEVFVYSVAANGWTRFEGLGAEQFFDFYGGVGFYGNGGLYLLTKDCTADESGELEASFETGVLDFEDTRKKQLLGIELACDAFVRAELYVDGGSLPSASASFGGDGHTRQFRRMSCRRFDMARVKLIASGDGRQVIHSINIIVR